MSTAQAPIAILTAGAGGMYCGSCLNDNTLAAALTRIGIETVLVPTYTPIRTDDADHSIDRVFLGGINVYLEERIPAFRYLPKRITRWLDNPRLIRWAASRGMDTQASQLGPLTVSMLRGAHGHQRREVDQLCDWLATDLRPRLVNISNILISGFVPALKAKLGIPILVTLQGDDIFLRQLPDRYQAQALDQIRRIDRHIDGYLVHSHYYAEHMSDFLGISRHKMHHVRLGIQPNDLHRVRQRPKDHSAMSRPLTIGYLARLAPEKGLHLLCEAFQRIRARAETHNVRLRVAGWLGPQHRQYANQSLARARGVADPHEVQYIGEVTRAEKRDFLHDIDLLSVPSPYREPKGIYVLESLAAAVPVVQPEHGAFPEMVRETGGGRLFRPDDVDHLSETIFQLLVDHDQRQSLGRAGQEAVRKLFSAESMAHSVWNVYQEFLPG